MRLGENLSHQWDRRINMMAEHVRALNDDDLIVLVRDAHEMLHVYQCFGLSDTWAFSLGAGELERRGYTVRIVDDLINARATLEVVPPARK